MFLKKRPSELNNMNPVIVFLTTYGFNSQKLCTKTNEQYFPGKKKLWQTSPLGIIYWVRTQMTPKILQFIRSDIHTYVYILLSG